MGFGHTHPLPILTNIMPFGHKKTVEPVKGEGEKQEKTHLQEGKSGLPETIAYKHFARLKG